MSDLKAPRLLRRERIALRHGGDGTCQDSVEKPQGSADSALRYILVRRALVFACKRARMGHQRCVDGGWSAFWSFSCLKVSRRRTAVQRKMAATK
jgi:hypothetical protein